MQFGAALMPLLVPVGILGLILGFVSTWALLIPALAVAAVASYAASRLPRSRRAIRNLIPTDCGCSPG